VLDVSTDQVAAAAEQVLGGRVLRAPEPQRGYSNANWRVDLDHGTYLVKLADPARDIEKVATASYAYRLAATTAAPVPHEVHFDRHCALLGGRAVRILAWLPGRHLLHGELTGEASTRFFFSLGRAVAQLHTAACPEFSSRIGGGAGFGTWLEYLDYRIPQIIGRNRTSGTFAEPEIAGMLEQARATAVKITDLVEPRLCHRDLYLDNFLIGVDGRVSAILDLDLAEAWDPAVDFVKLRSHVFPRFEGSEAAFTQGYSETAGGPLPGFDQRVRVVEVLELSNQMINANSRDDTEYALHTRRRLEAVLSADW
jgi:Ser/Thr protein kinase RdoA (MazF antagonist)